ncbi:MAG TPA: di-heme oxidoredictase family protein [Terriglobia bacterium]|nr:di-heme oxidoredictase family protein [Terriglobia bacterium]
MPLHPKSYRTSKSAGRTSWAATLTFLVILPFAMAAGVQAQTAKDPGLQTANRGTGKFIKGLTTTQQQMEQPASQFIAEVNRVAGGNSVKRVGLGARFDSNGCAACHAQPAIGGSSLAPTTEGGVGNPLFGVYQLMGAENVMPFFETANGPTLVARFPYKPDLVTPDGHVKGLFVITGRSDAGTCNIQQPDFDTAYAENNLIFRNTTPFFGGGLIEIIQDSDIIANMMSNLAAKMMLGISGHPNYNADDGSINRFGWKAQKRSLILFSGEAYNVEVGISNEFFPNKTDETPGCTPPFPEGPPNGNGPHGVPDDRTDWASLPAEGYLMPGDPERFGVFGRFMAPPAPGTCPGGVQSSCMNGQTQFNNVGCVLCHTTSFTTPPSSVAALGNQKANLFSDLLVHHMGPCDADNVSQGQAGGDEFRTTPLWGAGQRAFFMHDGRTSDIVQAVEDHYCVGNLQYGPSEANAVIGLTDPPSGFNGLSAKDQQDLINFLRSL